MFHRTSTSVISHIMKIIIWSPFAYNRRGILSDIFQVRRISSMRAARSDLVFVIIAKLVSGISESCAEFSSSQSFPIAPGKFAAVAAPKRQFRKEVGRFRHTSRRQFSPSPAVHATRCVESREYFAKRLLHSLRKRRGEPFRSSAGNFAEWLPQHQGRKLFRRFS